MPVRVMYFRRIMRQLSLRDTGVTGSRTFWNLGQMYVRPAG